MKPTRRGVCDFETFGWEAGEVVNALSCAMLVRSENPVWMYNPPPHRQSEQLVINVLEYMANRTDVDEWWAHNFGGFDGLQVLSALDRLKWNMEVSFAGQSRVIGMTVWHPQSQHRVNFKDSYALIQASLKSIQKDFHLSHAKEFEDEDYRGDMRDLPRDRLRSGNIADCRVLLEALEVVDNLAREFGGEMRSTFSSTSLNVALARLKKDGIEPQWHPTRCKCPKENAEGQKLACRCYWGANERAMQAYYGGRVEVLIHGLKALVQEWDVASSYSWSMSQVLPWKWMGSCKGELAQEAYQQCGKGLEGVFKAYVDVPKMHLPPLPYRDRNGLFFPTGDWVAWFPACELKYAQSLGVKVKILQGEVYKAARPFQGFIEDLYELKRTSEGAKRAFVKFLLNGCYGKFGERPERTRLRICQNEIEAYWLEVDKGGKALAPGSRFVQLTYTKWAKHAHFALASYVTARSRELIHKALRQATDPCYTDTDCVFARSLPLHQGDALGEMKLEMGGRKFRLEAYAPKIYRLMDPDTGKVLLIPDKDDPTKSKAQLACKGFPADEASFEKLLTSARTYHHDRGQGVTQKVAKAHARELGTRRTRMRLLKSQVRANVQGAPNVPLRVEENKSWGGLSMKRKPLRQAARGYPTRPWTVKEILERVFLNAKSPLL